MSNFGDRQRKGDHYHGTTVIKETEGSVGREILFDSLAVCKREKVSAGSAALP